MKALRVSAVVALFASLAGCWFGRPAKSPQQEFAEALMRGDAMRASRVWRRMSPEDRLKFSRGEGIAPDPGAKEAVKREILNRYQSELQGGPSGAGEAERQIPTPLGAGLRALSPLSGGASPPAAPQ